MTLTLLSGAGGIVFAPDRLFMGFSTASMDGISPPSQNPAAYTREIRLNPDPTDGSRMRDFFGNEVNDAVATYKLDATGLLYEEHSPQTEIPRLAEPKS